MNEAFGQGASVRVISGAQSKHLIGKSPVGWLGRILKVQKTEEKRDKYTVEWDSVTLAQIDEDALFKCIVAGFDYAWDEFFEDELEICLPRDTQSDVHKTQNKLDEKTFWYYHGAEGLQIKEIIKGVDVNSVREVMLRWYDYLSEKLKFPFEASIEDIDEEEYEIPEGAKVTVNKLIEFDQKKHDTLMVSVQYDNIEHIIPLINICPVNKSPNYSPIKLYILCFESLF